MLFRSSGCTLPARPDSQGTSRSASACRRSRSTVDGSVWGRPASILSPHQRLVKSYVNILHLTTTIQHVDLRHASFLPLSLGPEPPALQCSASANARLAGARAGNRAVNPPPTLGRRIRGPVRRLAVLLGDQLDVEAPALAGLDRSRDAILMAEVAEEATDRKSTRLNSSHSSVSRMPSSA